MRRGISLFPAHLHVPSRYGHVVHSLAQRSLSTSIPSASTQKTRNHQQRQSNADSFMRILGASSAASAIALLSYNQLQSPSIASSDAEADKTSPQNQQQNNNNNNSNGSAGSNSSSTVNDDTKSTDTKSSNGGEKSPLKRSGTKRDSSEMLIFAGSAGKELGMEIASKLNTTLSDIQVGRFSDGEVNVKITGTVRGKDVYIVQSTSPNVDDNLMELLLIISAASNSSAKRITAIVPYFGYMKSSGNAPIGSLNREHNKSSHRSNTLAAADVARMLEVMGTDRLITFDFQNPGQGSAEGFFNNTTVDPLNTDEEIVKNVAGKLGLLEESQKDKEMVVIAPHSRLIKKAAMFQAHLERSTGKKVYLAALIRNPLPTEDKSQVSYDLVGKSVKGRDVLIVDDVIITGKGIMKASKILKENGAERIYAFASHAVLTGDAASRLQNCKELEHVITLNTVPKPTASEGSGDNKQPIIDKLEYVSVAEKIANQIKKLHEET